MVISRFGIVVLAILGSGLWPGLGLVVGQASAESPSVPDSSAPPEAPLLIADSKADELIAEIAAKLAQVDRSQFDTEVLLDKHAYDATEIIRFVQEKIAFEDYSGVLRGVRGTLRSRAGNSVDQALLLASLLKDIGADARIVEGVIPGGELLSALLRERANAPGVYGQAGFTKQPGQEAQEDVLLPIPAEVGNITAQLTQALQSQKYDFLVAQEASTQESVAYFWVEYRDSPSSPWVGVHPIFPAGEVPVAAVQPKKYFADSIGEELQQRISVQAFIDRSWNGKIETLAVTKLYEYPAANLSGVNFNYSVIPNTDLAAAEGDETKAREIASQATLFFPVFNFGTAQFDMAFDTTGNILSADDASSDKAAIFQTVGGKFGNVADAIATGGDKASSDSKPQRYITRHWLKFIIQQPGREPKVIIRDIAQWQGDESEFKQSLSRSAHFRVETGAVAPAEFLQQNLRALKQSIETVRSPLSRKSLDQAALQFSLDAEVFLLASDMLARRQSETISYRDAPAIVARYAPYGRAALEREGFDIISSPRRVVSASTGQILPAGTIASGVIDTWLEYKLFAGEEWLQDSAFEKLAQRMQSGGRLTVLSPANSSGVEKIPEPGRSIMQREVSNQGLVLYPGPAERCDSWWRVDPVSGETIGMLDNGWGGASSEYITNLTIIYGRAKVGTALVSCSTVIAFIRGSAALTALNVFAVDDAMGMGGNDLCSQLPDPGLQALCTVIVVSAGVAGQAAAQQLSAETLKYLCIRAIFA